MRNFSAFAAGASALVVLYACVGDDGVSNNPQSQPDSGTPSTSGDSGSTPDPTSSGAIGDPIDSGNTVDAGPCNLAADFGTPVSLTALNTSFQEKSVTLVDDEKTAYWLSENKVMTATRASATDTFGTPAEVANLNAAQSWQSVYVAHDGEYLLLATTTQVFYSLKSSGAFGDPSTVSAPGSSGAVGTVFGESMYLNDDKSTVFYDQRKEAPDAGGLYFAKVLDPGDWDTPALIGPQFHGLGDNSPVLARDQLTLYFSGQRNSASPEVMKTTRPTTAAAWSDPAIVASVSSDQTDAPNWISADGCRLYLTSDSHGNDDLYVATRPH